MKFKNIAEQAASIRRASALTLMLCGAMLVPGISWALGSGVPDDATLTTQRSTEITSGSLVIAEPAADKVLQPVLRVPRKQFGVVSTFPLVLDDLKGLTFPNQSAADRQAVLEGMTFFTTPHTREEGAGPVANQRMCLGCHLSNAESINDPNIVHRGCKTNKDKTLSACVSIVSRAARATPTNFQITKDGVAPDSLDAINGPGQTASFTIFGDFDDNVDPLSLAAFDPLDGVNSSAQQLGGFVQHARPAISGIDSSSICTPDTIPTPEEDSRLFITDVNDPNFGDPTNNGWRRGVAERAGPPYIGRGLIEAVPNNDIVAADDPDDAFGFNSSLDDPGAFNCNYDCIHGHHNVIPGLIPPAIGGNAFSNIGGVGRFGLRANGAEIFQFIGGGLQGELGFTSLLNKKELNYKPGICSDDPNTTKDDPTPANTPDGELEVRLSTAFSERNFIRNISPPEFGDALVKVLKAKDPTKPLKAGTPEAMVQRGAELFGIDLIAFKNRMAGKGITAGADGRNDHAINVDDIMVGCASCHTPIQRTGESPSSVGKANLSYRWAPIFSDLILHEVPDITAERKSAYPRNPVLIKRPQMRNLLNGTGNLASDFGVFYRSFDIPRNLADDIFSNQKATAHGTDFRTAPLMGMGRMGPPYMHDARVYLSINTYNTTPASTVATNSDVTNAPLVVRSVDEAIRAAIELHDLPPPDDTKTPAIYGAGCPVPKQATNIDYGDPASDVICPSYESPNRSEAREVIRRYRSLSPADQLALIAFLKQL